MTEQSPIFEKPTDDYLRVRTESLAVFIANPQENADRILRCYDGAMEADVELLALPELSLTGYSAADMFFDRHVLTEAENAVATLAQATVSGPAMIVGAPLEKDGLLYNCGIVLAEGKVAGVVPKTHLPNYNEFYEQRWFTSGKGVADETITIGDETVPFGTDLLFDVNGTKVGLEICEDAFAPISPGTHHALAGAEVIVNLSASNELIGKADYRRRVVTGHAANLMCAYVYTSAGDGESTADVTYGGHQIISEAGKLSGEVKPFSWDDSITLDIDRVNLAHDRLVNKTYADQAADQRKNTKYRTISVTVPQPDDETLLRTIEKGPFVPNNPETLNERCEELFQLMAEPLYQRLVEADAQAVVLGLSGGLDSTLALLTATYATKILYGSHADIHTITMPSTASSERTQSNATLLAEALGTTHTVAPIKELSAVALAAIGHDGTTQDITYENTQARMRKLLLMNYANKVQGIDLGTGDMSEIAQGWCTYNGDHMSMFNPNSGVPKTLVKHLVRWYADNRADEKTAKILRDILDTPISPELTGDGNLDQETEDILGPYELHDFFLYHSKRYGTQPKKIGYLAAQAFADEYSEAEIEKWLTSYLNRFTKNQWKREAMPNGTKLGTIALSPRGDHRMAPNTSPSWHGL